jgi:hypothetical protein
LGKNQPQPIRMAWLNAGFAARLEKLLKPFVREAFDHAPIVT